MLFRDFTTILDVTDAGTDPVTGAAYRLNPLPADKVQDHEQEVVLVVSGAHSGGMTDPSVKVIVESSTDGQTWHEMWSGQYTQQAFKAVDRPKLDPMGGATTPSALFSYVRARTELFGGTAPSQDRVVVQIGSTAPLRMRKV